MLDHKSIESVITLASKLAADKKVVAALPDTPIASLLREITFTDADNDLSTEELVNTIVDLSRGENHADNLSAQVKFAAEAVRHTLDVTRNQVYPHILRVVNSYNERLPDDLYRSPFIVEAVYAPAVYRHYLTEELLENSDNTPAETIKSEIALCDITEEEFLKLCTVSRDGDYNKLLEELLTPDNVGSMVSVLKGRLNYNRLDKKLALPFWIVCHNLRSVAVKTDLNQEEFHGKRALLSTNAYRDAGLVLRELNARIRHKTLYMSLTDLVPDGGYIRVCGEVYSKLLKEGLTVETIIGNEILKRHYTATEMLQPEIAEKLKEVYQKDHNNRVLANKVDMDTRARNIMRYTLRDDVLNIAKEGKFILEGDDEAKALGRLMAVVNKIDRSIHRDVEPTTYISAVIYSVWYAHTDAWRVLDGMLEIEKTLPNLSPAEMATMTTFYYIANWVASQLTLVDEVEVKEAMESFMQSVPKFTLNDNL